MATISCCPRAQTTAKRCGDAKGDTRSNPIVRARNRYDMVAAEAVAQLLSSN